MRFEIQRGTNISHWLSQSDARGATRRARFTREDVRRIAGWGFDHVRLPVDEEQLWTVDGAREPEAFELLGLGLDWCEEAGLRAVVDLHILRSHHFLDKQPALYSDPAEAVRFGSLWADLAEFLRGRAVERVAYELMNEPVARDDADWNRVLLHPYRAIRDAEPERTILLGSNRWQSCDTFERLDVPAAEWGRDRMILSFHFYLPLLVTHYRANWSEPVRDYEGPVSYPGRPILPADWAALPPALRARLEPENQPWDAARMAQALAQPLAVSARTGLRLYCGEFGVYERAPAEPRLRWYRDFMSVLNRHAIAWANWDFRGCFGLVTADGRETMVLRGLGLRQE